MDSRLKFTGKVRKCKNEDCQNKLPYIRPTGLRNFCSMQCKKEYEYKRNKKYRDSREKDKMAKKNKETVK